MTLHQGAIPLTQPSPTKGEGYFHSNDEKINHLNWNATIVVRLEIDHDGDEYLEIYVVFDGDQKNLDPGWANRLPGHIWSESIAIGVPSVPGISAVEKSEWAELLASKYAES